MKYVLSFIVGILATNAHAIVDMKNANFAQSWTDIELPGSGYDLKVERTYNSRSLFNGIFGFGWCSDWETTLEVTAEGYLRITECGAGIQLTYKPKEFNPKAVDKTIQKIMAEVKKRNPRKPKPYFTNLEKTIRNDELIRQEFEDQLNLRGNIKDGTKYIVDGRDGEYIIKNGKTYTRTIADGSKERFNENGQLIALYDRNNNYLKFGYKGKQMISATDNNGRKLTFKYNPSTKKIAIVVGPNGVTSTYKHKNEDLIYAQNSKGEVYTYKYDELHNLTKMVYPDKTTRELQYNKDKDWVVGFKNRKDCQETYKYESDKNDPINHYWSEVVKKCGKKVTNRSRYEFWHQDKSDGTGKYLYRVKSDVNGETTDIVYHDIFGKPISVVRNSSVTRYSYYKDGRVKLKSEPLRDMTFFYSGKCDKVSKVKIAYIAPSKIERRKKNLKKPKRKTLKTVTTEFKYDAKRCNLVFAKNSVGQTASIKYDKNGRIAAIKDQSKKTVKIKYEARFGKPWIVTRPGLGTIKVLYDNNGGVKSVKSKDGPRVAVQVASIFNNLLDIIAPATSETPL